MTSAFDGRFHLIRYSDGEEEFYDVASDPLEQHDLRARFPRLAGGASIALLVDSPCQIAAGAALAGMMEPP